MAMAQLNRVAEGSLRYGDLIMLFHVDKWSQSASAPSAPSSLPSLANPHSHKGIGRVPCVMSYGFLDDKVRIQFLKYDHEAMDIDVTELRRDTCFGDKLFKVVPEMKFNFKQEKKEFEDSLAKLPEGARKNNKFMKYSRINYQKPREEARFAH